jgi:hypothetical protein
VQEYDKTMPGLIKDWVSRSAKFRANDQGVYSIASLEPQYMYVAMMTCRLFGREDTSHFYIAWVPLIFRVAEGCSFNWAKILSDSLFNRVTEYREQKAAGRPSSFFMSAYIMDAICSMTPFPLMNWAWNPTQSDCQRKERRGCSGRFQEAVIATNNRFSAGSPGLTIAEQTRGNILLKDWEHNITLSKEQAQKVTNSLEEAFNAIDGELLGMESGGDSETLRQMNVDQISLDMKEKNERDSAEISKMDRVDMAQVDKHLIQPSAQLSALDIIDAQMGDKLPQLARECYFAEASCQAEPSQLVSQFVDKCIIYTESMQRQAPGTF